MKEPIRILHVVGSLGVGGIQSYLMNIYRNIDRSRIQFDFVVHIRSNDSYIEEVKSLGGKVIYIYNDAFEKKDWRTYYMFWKDFFRENSEYKIVHGHLRSTASVYLSIAKKAGLYTIAHSHATSNGYGKMARVKDMLQIPVRYIADYYMGCSYAANEWMFGKRKAESSNCKVLYNGIDVKKYEYNEKIRNRIRVSLGLNEHDFLIGTVGRLVLQKNQMVLIDAMPKILEKKPQAKLIIVGDGILRKELEKKIMELGIDDKVLMLGTQTNINELLCAMDIFALPSRNEGLGIVAIEAQAAGLPTIVSSAVPEEVYITPLVSCVEGESKAENWTKAIVCREIKRENVSDLIIQAGYNIESIAAWLCEFYTAHA